MNMKDEIYTLFESIGDDIKQQFSNNNYYSFIKYHKDTKERKGAIRQWYSQLPHPIEGGACKSSSWLP